MLEILTFTGVDGETSPSRLLDITNQYPDVEFGVLIGTNTDKKSHKLFPSLDVVRSFKRHGNFHRYKTAIHLCGKYSRMILGDGEIPVDLYELCDGFGRVQINVSGHEFDTNRESKIAHVELFADTLLCEKVILPHKKKDWSSVPVKHPKVEYLFDLSGGRGESSFSKWPVPSADLSRMGYAGGIGPHNAKQALAFADQYPDVPLWLDMESKVRTLDRWFDLEAVENVCKQIFVKNQD